MVFYVIFHILILFLCLKPVNQQSFQHPIVEDAAIIKIRKIFRKFLLEVVESVATAEEESVIRELGGEINPPPGKTDCGTADVVMLSPTLHRFTVTFPSYSPVLTLTTCT